MNPTIPVTLTVQAVQVFRTASGSVLEIALANSDGQVLANIRGIDPALATTFIANSTVMLTVAHAG